MSRFKQFADMIGDISDNKSLEDGDLEALEDLVGSGRPLLAEVQLEQNIDMAKTRRQSDVTELKEILRDRGML